MINEIFKFQSKQCLHSYSMVTKCYFTTNECVSCLHQFNFCQKNGSKIKKKTSKVKIFRDVVDPLNEEYRKIQ